MELTIAILCILLSLMVYLLGLVVCDINSNLVRLGKIIEQEIKERKVK